MPHVKITILSLRDLESSIAVVRGNGSWISMFAEYAIY